jgi:hypothetical protein
METKRSSYDVKNPMISLCSLPVATGMRPKKLKFCVPVFFSLGVRIAKVPLRRKIVVRTFFDGVSANTNDDSESANRSSNTRIKKY